MSKKQIIHGLNSKNNYDFNTEGFKKPKFMTEGVSVPTTVKGCDCYFHNGSFYWVENGSQPYKQDEGDRVYTTTYAIRPGTDRLSYGSGSHWDRHLVVKGFVRSFADAEAAIARHLITWTPSDPDTRPCAGRLVVRSN